MQFLQTIIPCPPATCICYMSCYVAAGTIKPPRLANIFCPVQSVEIYSCRRKHNSKSLIVHSNSTDDAHMEFRLASISVFSIYIWNRRDWQLSIHSIGGSSQCHRRAQFPPQPLWFLIHDSIRSNRPPYKHLVH
jgi:hypothetical protein